MTVTPERREMEMQVAERIAISRSVREAAITELAALENAVRDAATRRAKAEERLSRMRQKGRRRWGWWWKRS